jgi:flagellar biosynthesis protein FlhA
LQREAEFYGAMDGASKFVKGDAIAGLVITGINILGGFAIGVLQRGMDFSAALKTYTILTIGDGLFSQVRALLVSVAAGLIISRTSSSASLDKDLSTQLTGKPRPLLVVAGVSPVLGLLPGFPFFPLLSWVLQSVALGFSDSGKSSRLSGKSFAKSLPKQMQRKRLPSNRSRN